MNIADKPRFYREAFRALRPGGVLALSNNCAGEAGEPYFPVPWATTSDTSFLDSVGTDPRRSGSSRVRDRRLRGHDRNAQGSRPARACTAPAGRIAPAQPASDHGRAAARDADQFGAQPRRRPPPIGRGAGAKAGRIAGRVTAAANFAKFAGYPSRLGAALRLAEYGFPVQLIRVFCCRLAAEAAKPADRLNLALCLFGPSSVAGSRPDRNGFRCGAAAIDRAGRRR